MHKNYFGTFIKSIFLMQLFLLVLITGVSAEISSPYLEKMPAFNIQNILLPFKGIELNKKQAASLFREVNVVFAGEKTSFPMTRYYFKEKMPEDLMISSIQALAYGRSEEDLRENEGEFEVQLPEVEPEPLEESRDIDYSSFFKDCKVVFYCTHSAESYIPDSGRARCDGQRGLVNEVARSISESLSKRGLPAEFEDRVHDFPDYNKSYTNSRETVQKILQSNNKLLALFDIHRDSIPGLEKAETVEIDGKKSARILIIVGTDERKSHPEWRKNLEFAQEIYRQGEKKYPGLIKGIRTKAGTYNQEFFPRALLLEFGGDLNSLAEAHYAGMLFSDILIEVLKEDL